MPQNLKVPVLNKSILADAVGNPVGEAVLVLQEPVQIAGVHGVAGGPVKVGRGDDGHGRHGRGLGGAHEGLADRLVVGVREGAERDLLRGAIS